MQKSLVQRLRVLGHQQNWNLTPENVVMGLQCCVSTIHHALLLLNKDTPIAHQLNMAHTLTDIANIAVYLIHLQYFLLDEGEDGPRMAHRTSGHASTVQGQCWTRDQQMCKCINYNVKNGGATFTALQL